MRDKSTGPVFVMEVVYRHENFDLLMRGKSVSQGIHQYRVLPLD